MQLEFMIGNAAALLTSISFLPQALYIIRTKDTRSISLPMYVLFVTGVSLWLTYGLMIGDVPVILANCITVVLSGVILYYKVNEIRAKVKSQNS